MSADEDLLHCAVCLFSGTAVQVITHQWWHHSDIGSGSAVSQLRQVQEALAASQADLTHVEGQLRDAEQERMRAERERDEAVRRAADLEQAREELKQLRLCADGYVEDIRQLESERDEHIDSLRGQRDLAREGLAAAQAARLATERERDGVREELARMAAESEDLRATLAMRTGQLLSARTEIDHLKAELREAYAHTQPANRKES